MYITNFENKKEEVSEEVRGAQKYNLKTTHWESFNYLISYD